MIVWIIFGSKLLCSHLMLTIYFFLKYLPNRQTQTSSGNVENTVTHNPGVDRLCATCF